MANMQRHMYPLADIADAFQKLNDDATPDEIADVATQAIEDLAEVLASLEMTDRTSVRLIDRWKKTMAHLRSATNDNGSRVAQRLLEVNKGKSVPVSVETDEGQVICTPKVTVRRSEIQRDELIRAVERAASQPANRVDPTGTGELLDYDTAKVLLFKKAFRMEPRWTDLKKLGINDDEFCRKESSYSLDIKESQSL
jgi:hypothetical protein